MSGTLFPIAATAAATAQETALPLYRDVRRDAQGRPVARGGEFVIVSGAEAVASWAYGALATVRYRHDIYSWNYGAELEGLIGQAASEDLKTADAPRLVREALTVCPYIESVKNIEVTFSGGKMAISATLETIYGEVGVRA